MSGRTRAADELLLGEWACLGILVCGPAHGFAVAARLRPDGDIGRVWSMSRALTYRALDQLLDRGLVRPVTEEPGVAGGTRTVLGPTAAGRRALRRWVATPVAHLRDLRSELLVKLIVARGCAIDVLPMVHAQLAQVRRQAAALTAEAEASGGDVVARWRAEASAAAVRFLEGFAAVPADRPTPG